MGFLNYFLAFIEGLALIISPCILPLLPIILSGSIEGGKRKPLGIIVGFISLFSLFTLLSHFLVQHVAINLNLVRDLAFILIIFFGFVMISDYLSQTFSSSTQKLANFAGAVEMQSSNQRGFLSGLILGALLGLIWTPCAGPILAAALLQIATQKTTLNSVISLVFFAFGSVLPMILIAFLGKKIIAKTNILKQHGSLLRKICGGIIAFCAAVLLFINHFDPEFFAKLANTSPSVSNHSESTINPLDDAITPYPAPELAGINAWINSPPLRIAQLLGKVVLIDFWTYSCINCIRTLPYLLAWDKAYRNKGLVIIGVHTPEFEFEKNLNNVKDAVKRDHILYPVALDNDYTTWSNYANQYWPAHYLINKNGLVVYQHFGEGDYATTENNIRQLLGINRPIEEQQQAANLTYQTPETYLGYDKMETFASPEKLQNDKIAQYTIPHNLPLNAWALQGAWLIAKENIISKSANAELILHFHSQHVYAVMGAAKPSEIKINLLVNGKLVSHVTARDVKDNTIRVNENRLYEIADFPTAISGEIRLIVSSRNVEFYTFTF